jgi:hypothetical protein
VNEVSIEKFGNTLKHPTTKMFLKNGNLTVTLDRAQVFPDDPGEGTPIMVEWTGKAGATYNCAVNEGILSGYGNNEDKELTDKQLEWLDSLENKIEEFLQ